jgi:hypothetical protein
MHAILIREYLRIPVPGENENPADFFSGNHLTSISLKKAEPVDLPERNQSGFRIKKN